VKILGYMGGGVKEGASYELSAISYQLSAIGYRLSAIRNYWLLSANGGGGGASMLQRLPMR